MAVVADPARVAYVVSADLVRYADLLPSNEGRSSHVHSLAYHLDLLDLSTLDDVDHSDNEDDAEGDKGMGSSQSSQRRQFLASIGADRSSSAATKQRRRAAVYLPHAATRQQLTGYHGDSFVQRLAEGRQASRSASPPLKKRRKDGSGVGTSEGSDADSGAESADAAGSSGTSRGGDRNPKNQFGLQDDCPAFEGLSRHVSLIAGASITAAELLATGQADIAIAWDGGRHHAKKHAASGFCYVNDVVLAILALRRPRKVTITTAVPNDAGEMETVRKTTVKRVQRVLYLDLDLHWGDGVEEAFHTSANVLTLSVHHYAPGFFPCYAPSRQPERWGPPGSLRADPGAGSAAINIPLAPGTSDASLERIMEAAVQKVYEAWHPEVVVVQCGVDGLAADPMAVWNLSAAAYLAAVRRVLGWKKPTLLLGGGGYDTPNAARCWSLLTALTLGRYNDTSKERHAAAKNRDQPTPLVDRATSPPKDPEDKADLDVVSLETPIPDHKFWPNYHPHYTLNVPAGEMIDHNQPAHFDAIQSTLDAHLDILTKPSSLRPA